MNFTRVQRFTRVQINQLNAQLILSKFRQPLLFFFFFPDRASQYFYLNINQFDALIL